MSGKGDTFRPVDKAKYDATFDAVFGKRKPGKQGRTRYVFRNGQLVEGNTLDRDGELMRSMAMGCVSPAEQAKRLAQFGAKGIDAHYDRDTGELCFKGGYHAQKRLARMHELEVG